MQCAACRAVYSNELDICPRCQRPAQKTAPPSEKINAKAPRQEHKASTATANAPANTSHAAANDSPVATATATATATPPSGSTLIEFPGTGRAARPQWRKELSERVREIQQRRAREAQEAEEVAQHQPDYGATPDDAAAPAQPLGLVPPRDDAPPLNPLVAAALRRIERARQPSPPPMSRSNGGRTATATAVARVAEEDYQPAAEPALVTPLPRPVPPKPNVNAAAPAAEAHRAPQTMRTEKTTEPLRPSTESPRASGESLRASGLVALPTQQPAKAEAAPVQVKTETHALPASHAATTAGVAPSAVSSTDATIAADSTNGTATATTAAGSNTTTAAVAAATTTTHVATAKTQTANAPASRRVFSGVVDELSLERREAEITEAANTVPVVNAAEIYDDRAPKLNRILAGLLDILVVAFFSSPFAAVIELTSGRWHDPRVSASMGGIILVVMFLYLAGSTALAGYTWGMSIFSLRAVDARTAMAPTTGQSMRRAIFYMLSLVTLGVPLLYALFDAEGRATHDHLSGTIIVRE
ncbi:MAG TPA: RDD family protein [Pyrinomonadaceae bacterium]|jgi:uncharacterized RDD family membrane protein YckC